MKKKVLKKRVSLQRRVLGCLVVVVGGEECEM